MAALITGAAQTPIHENACQDAIESALNLPAVLDAGVALYDPEGVLRLDYAKRRDNQPSPFARVPLDHGSVTYRAVQSGQTVCVHECATNAPYSPVAQDRGIDVVKAAPVVVDGQPIGAVVVTATQRQMVTAAHRTTVNALAAELGLKLSHRMLRSRYSHLQQLYAALHASNRLLIGPARTRNELYATACQICVRHAGFALAWIARPDDNGWFRTLAVAGPARGLSNDMPTSIDAEIPEGNGSMGQAWRKGRAVYLQAPRTEHQYRHWYAAYETHGIYGIASVPLKRNGRVDAVLAVGATEANYFGDEERLLFEEIGIDLSELLNQRDSLTGLPETQSFHQILADSMDAAAGHGLVLIRIGVRDLASINNAYGYAGGDQVLVDLADRLRQSLPGSALVARLGGDNFVVLSRAVRRDAVDRVARRLLRRIEASVEQPFEIEGDAIPVMLATGVASHPADTRKSQGLLARAEVSLGQTRSHYARSRMLSEDQPETIQARLATATDLRHALQEGHGIQPWYQPKVDLHQGTLIGAEALARWQDASRGLVSPGEFLPLVDVLGMTTQLDRTIRDAVLGDLARWHKPDDGAVPVAINLSASQLTDDDLTRRLLAALEAHELPASLLHVEVTEHDVIEDVAAARTVLQQLQAAGIEVVLDDFGTGYSSLSMLRDLPLSKLKLDKSFVDRVADDARSLNVARLAIELAHTLEMKVVAEGIETQDQADVLRGLGCDYAQGFFFARPMPASDFEARWLRGERSVKHHYPDPTTLTSSDKEVAQTDLARLLGPRANEMVPQTRSGVLITDARIDPPGPRIIYANPAFCEITGYAASEVLGCSPRILQGPLTERPVLDQLRYCLKREQVFLGQVWNYRKDGSVFLMEWSVAPLRLDGGLTPNQETVTHFIAMQRDVTTEQALDDQRHALSARNQELKQALDQLNDIADADDLTGAYNRRYLFRALEREIERSNHSGQPLAICMLDIDRFKAINDSHGHQIGDEILLELIVRVRESIRGADALGPLVNDHVLSRYGGEEFLIILPLTDRAGAMNCAERVREAIGSQPFTTRSGAVQVRVSLGITQYDSTQDTVETLIGRADAALFRAKTHGRNRVEAAPVAGPEE